MPPEAKLKFEEVTRSLLTHIQFIRSESISSLRHSIRVAERESFHWPLLAPEFGAVACWAVTKVKAW